ncbi:hypothetical protein [Synechocystis sp. LKSZ1]|uniref:hypothetical protein n=1 Tax=Synechocystis sp. LKSZ1 TaxID=3144951 RepID=UPI00336C08C9
MRNLKYVGLALAASLVSVFLWFNPLPSPASQPTVQVQTEPALSQVIPDEASVRVALQAVDPMGQPLSDVRFQLQLLTPAKTPWFTSDFPIVEGTKLLELNAKAPSGKLEFEQVMPIRGNYMLKAQVTPLVAGAFEPFEQSLKLSVPERFVKYRNAAILIGILILVGGVSGWIIGGDQTVQDGEIAPQPIRLLLSAVTVLAIAVLLFVNISAELASAHAREETQTTTTLSVQRSQDLEIRLSGDQRATVGRLASQTIQIFNAKTGNPEVNVIVNAKSIALEDNKQMFAYQGSTDDQGKLTWNEQFFDGAPHQVIAEVTPPNGVALQVSHEVEVERIEPPLYIRFISLSYYTGIFALSLLAGIWFHRRSSRSSILFSR